MWPAHTCQLCPLRGRLTGEIQCQLACSSPGLEASQPERPWGGPGARRTLPVVLHSSRLGWLSMACRVRVSAPCPSCLFGPVPPPGAHTSLSSSKGSSVQSFSGTDPLLGSPCGWLGGKGATVAGVLGRGEGTVMASLLSAAGATDATGKSWGDMPRWRGWLGQEAP